MHGADAAKLESMQRGRLLGYVTPTLLVAVLVLLGLSLWQQNNLEERFIVQGRQLRAIGEATDKIVAGGVRVASGASPAAAGAPPGVKVLHPDVQNFLGEKQTHWPPAGASTTGALRRGWASGDPKGFNSLIENAADLSDLEAYIGCKVAERNIWADPDVLYSDTLWRVEVTDDYKEFTLYLKKGIKWHPVPNVNLDDPKFAWLKGDHEVTAHDLAFTFDMIMNPQVENGFLKNYYSDIESWKAIDDYTFVVRWKKKGYLNVSSTLELAVIPEFVFAHGEDGKAIPKETVGLRFNQHWYNNKGYVGCGPYRMASYEAGNKIRLERNDDYIGEKPAIREIVYPIYTDQQQTVLKLKAHELSVGGLMPGQYRDEIQNYEKSGQKPPGSPFFNGNIQHQTIDAAVFYYIGWNADKPMFADKRVRQAMTMAFNRQQVIDSVFAGLGKIATGPYLPGTPYNDPGVKPWPFDLARAKALLKEAGWEDTDGDGLLDKELHPGDGKRTPFTFSLLIYGTSKEYASMANIYRDDLLKIGVKMTIDAAEWSLMQKRMDEKKFDAYTGGWGLTWVMDLFQIFHSSQADIPKGSNRVGFRNKEADQIIEQLRVEFDQQKRIELLRHFHRLVHEEQPYTFFRVPKAVFCWWKDIHNVVFAKTGYQTSSLPWWSEQGG